MALTSSPRSQGLPTVDRVRSLPDEDFWGIGKRPFDEFLDTVREELSASGSDASLIPKTIEDLFNVLRVWRQAGGEDEWADCVRTCREHPLKALVHEDPFTYRAFSKPRGYAGDAEMMDFIYSREDQRFRPPASWIGGHVFDYTTSSPASRGVRARRGFVSGSIDRVALEIPAAHVLSVASGHLREAELCEAVKHQQLGRYVALDADPLSLAQVEQAYGHLGVEAIEADIRELVAGRLEIGDYDLIYTTGLYDYLSQRLGRRLAANLFRMLRPRGRLVIANFLPGIHDVGYMEAYMDWFLVYRNREEMINLTMEIPQEEIRDITLWSEQNQNILFLEVSKA